MIGDNRIGKDIIIAGVSSIDAAYVILPRGALAEE